jgi:PAS domain S-box-containing protein
MKESMAIRQMLKNDTGTSKRKLRRMSGDLLIGLTGIVIVTAGVSMMVSYNLSRRESLQILQNEADQYLSYLIGSLERPAWNMDEDTSRQIGDAYMTAELFSFLEIVFDDGEERVVYSKRKADGGALVLREGPLIYKNGIVGRVRIGLSEAPHQRARSRLLTVSLWTSVAVILAVIGATLFLLRLFVRKPMNLLMDVAKDMADGHYEHRETEIKHHEIAMVHNQLVVMAERIKGRELSLKEANIRLSSAVARREASEVELRNLRNYLYNIINSMPSVLVAVDRNSRVTQWNKQTEEFTGLSFEKARGQPLSKVFPLLAGEMKRIDLSIRERRVISVSRKQQKSDVEVRYEDITIYPLAANGAEGAVIRVDDVTQRVRMEEMMVQSEKMLSVGGLAAGMAHEINNPLAGMMQTAEVMAGRLEGNIDIPANRRAAEAAGVSLEGIKRFMDNRGIPRMLGAITESGKRVAAIVNNMLSFARKSEAAVSSHCLETLLDQALDLAATDYDLKKEYDFKRIEIEREYAGNLPEVPCEAGKIQQVLLNLLRNGAQAMQEAKTESPRFTLRTKFDPGRRMGIIEVEDNGPGMDDETRKRIFEPFFTTKPVGIGTGLGLSVSYFIITENHSGEMAVSSSPGAGATFTIRLPVGREAG